MNLQIPKPARRWAATAAGAALLTLSVPYAAQAGSQAFAQLSYSNFLFKDLTDDPTGGDVLQLGVDVLIGINNFSDKATHIAARGDGPGSPDSVFTQDEDTDPSNSVLVNALIACVGPDCGGAVPTTAQNIFSQGDITNDEYTRSDSLVFGSGLDIGFLDDSTGFFLAESIAQGTVGSLSQAEFTNTTEFTITPLRDIKIGLAFDVVTDLYVELDALATGNSKATTNYGLSINSGGVSVIYVNGNPGDLNFPIAVTTPGDSIARSIVDSFEIETAIDLLKGVAYTLTLDYGAKIDLNTTVPEPSTLAIMGLGLIGFSLRLRGKKA